MAGHVQQEFLGMPAVVASEAMSRVMESARRVANAKVAVLITGETGTGKEIVARAVHHWSLRCARPWVDVNCAALPDHLMESELFGHERGAFSGADSTKAGLYELAHTGTLFLDEVAELDPRMQAKLLRVLDGVPYYRLGGQRKVSADVRVIAATNQDLRAAAERGRFRTDLFHRLNQFQIRVPPLRERVEDILPLAEFFLAQHSAQASLSEDACSLLRRYPWRGNVRELRNAITHAVINATRYEIAPADLPREVVAGAASPPPAELNLDGVEREAIHHALAQTRGHHQQAADLLGISRRTLSRKLRSYRDEAAADEVHFC